MSFQADDVCIYCGEYYATHNSGNKCRKGKVENIFAKAGSITLGELSPGVKVAMYCNGDRNIINDDSGMYGITAVIMSTPYPYGFSKEVVCRFPNLWDWSHSNQ